MNTTTSPATFAVDPAAKNDGTPKPGKRRMAREPKNEKQQPAVAPMPNDAAEHATKTTAKEPRGPSKIASVIALLERPEGATLAELVKATGWLPHTTRAALTGLKKKGHVITKDKRGDATCYRSVKAA